MSEPRSRSSLSFAEQLKSLVITPEVLRLILDVTACTVEWDGEAASIVSPQARGLELFPCFAMYFQRHLVEVKGAIFPNLAAREWEGLSHVIRLELPGMTLDVRLHTLQTTFLLSPFHIRFLSILFGRLVLHQLSLTPEGPGQPVAFYPVLPGGTGGGRLPAEPGMGSLRHHQTGRPGQPLYRLHAPQQR